MRNCKNKVRLISLHIRHAYKLAMSLSPHKKRSQKNRFALRARENTNDNDSRTWAIQRLHVVHAHFLSNRGVLLLISINQQGLHLHDRMSMHKQQSINGKSNARKSKSNLREACKTHVHIQSAKDEIERAKRCSRTLYVLLLFLFILTHVYSSTDLSPKDRQTHTKQNSNRTEKKRK